MLIKLFFNDENKRTTHLESLNFSSKERPDFILMQPDKKHVDYKTTIFPICPVSNLTLKFLSSS